jgi:hypothetical protein
MATLHAYVDKDGYYVRHSFATGGKLYHVIYQTTEAAVQRLEAQGVRESDSIPKGLLHELISVGDLFTGKTGAGSTGLDPEPTKALDDSDMDISSLSVEARKWFGLMMICHPSGKVLKRKRGQFLILIHKVSAETGSGVSDGLKTDETYRCENRVRVGGRKTPSDGCSDGSAGLAKNNEVVCCRTRSSNPCGTAPSAVK